ncbi:hypothetical protein LTR04_001702 [Oleoguttula sp. CCFEE 6159]|nr:hypothetical protein LTR04_001702 [Oleoguttula sp. CCFEE 6159]
MRILSSFFSATLLASAGLVSAASSWGFEDATLSVQGKGSGVGNGLKEKLDPSTPLSKFVSLGASDTLKIILTASEDKTPKKPHQALLTLREASSGLEESYPFSVKDTGKAKVEVTHKDLPIQLLSSSQPLSASLVIGSFGSATPLQKHVFDLTIQRDPNTPLAIPSPPLRYGQLPEIHHIFRSDPKNPPKIISLFFTLAVLATLPVLLGSWLMLGANFNHLGKALGGAPVSHALFFGSIVALEGIFFLYYTSWNLFQTLPAAAAVGLVAFLSGSRALSEVQERRLAGLR